jgi:hypothetical protein
MSGAQRAARPAIKMMRVMLSNGATLQMPTPALKTRPYYAKQVSPLLAQQQWSRATASSSAAATAAAAGA